MTVAAQTDAQRDEYGRGAEKWVPKVGDRVVHDYEAGGEDLVAHWNAHWKRERGELVDNTFVVTGITGGLVHYSNTAGGPGPMTPSFYFKPAPFDNKTAADNDNGPKLEVGNRVRVTTLRHGEAQLGKIGTIVDTHFPSKTLPIEISYDEPMPSGLRKNQYGRSDLEPLLEPTAIVALIENGQPKPNKQPKIHPGKAGATTEAERLALKFPGQKFGVFVLADTRIADIVTTKTAVLRAS